MMDPDSDPTTRAQDALATVIDEWLSRRGVVSIEVARRWQAGSPTGEVGIRVTVARILAPDDVPDGELFPRGIDGVPVDLVEGSAPVLEADVSVSAEPCVAPDLTEPG